MAYGSGDVIRGHMEEISNLKGLLSQLLDKAKQTTKGKKIFISPIEEGTIRFALSGGHRDQGQVSALGSGRYKS